MQLRVAELLGMRFSYPCAVNFISLIYGAR
jgi:hypothetical protein